MKYDIPNTPWNEDHVPPEKDDPASHTSSYTGFMSISPHTEVTEL